MTGQLVFDPLIPWQILAVIAVIALVGVGIAAMRGLSGWVFRGLAALVVLGALAGPGYQQEDRAPLTDIVLLLEDESASQQLSDRPDQTGSAADQLAAQIGSRSNTEVRRITVPDGDGDAGTQLITALSKALAEEPRNRIAGIVALTDGQVHDANLTLYLPAPMHTLLSGKSTDWDRRLSIRNAPAFAIIGEPVTLTLRVEDMGAAPGDSVTSPLTSCQRCPDSPRI